MVKSSGTIGCSESPRWGTPRLTRESVKLCKARRRPDAYARNRRIASTDSLGQTTTYDYDLLGRQTRVTYPNPDGGGEGLVLAVRNRALDVL